MPKTNSNKLVLTNQKFLDENQFLEAAKDLEGFSTNGRLDINAEIFLLQIATDVFIDDIVGLSLEDLAFIAHKFWIDNAQKSPSSRLTRIYSAKDKNGKDLGRDILEVVGPDCEFLVDSIMGEIGAQGIEVKAMFHPIIDVRRDDDGVRGREGVIIRESYIQVHFPPLSIARRESILVGLKNTLDDVRLAVEDFGEMRSRMRDCIKELAVANIKASGDEIAESIAFLKWLEAGNFVFLGARSYTYEHDGNGVVNNESSNILESENLGILRDPLRSVLRRSSEPKILSKRIVEYLEDKEPIVVAKANLESRVHRRAIIDYIGFKKYDEHGHILGEDRFIGLFTAEAYDENIRDVPLLRHKLQNTLKASGFEEGSHNYKRFINIIENYPRDELFQIEEKDLLRICLGILHLLDRPKTKVFVRRDKFDRFMSVLVFVPRDRYNSQIRQKIGQELINAFDGRLSAFYPTFSDSPLARVHYIIGVNPFEHKEPNIEELEEAISAMTFTWEDALEKLGEQLTQDKFSFVKYLGGFSEAYKEAYKAEEALIDLKEIFSLKAGEVKVRAYKLPLQADNILRTKLYKYDSPLALSEAMPIFESMGLYVESEAQYRIKDNKDNSVYVHDVLMRDVNGEAIDFDKIKNAFETGFVAVWSKLAENDGFNRLITGLGISWREASLMRAFARWRAQTGLDPSQSVVEQALSEYSEITLGILDLFNARFNPSFNADRNIAQKEINEYLNTELNKVQSLDADRALRRILGMVNNMVRTNYFQTENEAPKPYMSFKIITKQIKEVPDPKPYREIWVYSPIIEGAHLRFGPVARGGLRWSDRRDDFRTEVLGLVKAQQVKNAVIVPVGSKGAFFPKALPKTGTRDEIQAAAIDAYKIFLSGMLDITDNIGKDGGIISPNLVIRHDADDPYLVVAADKGTATFSDIANSISLKYNHWLGDAFASGGSQGYDHKKMGITARGAWEAVKRHFREIGKDIQTESFNVIGVGDMSGDVFGNGMLLSRKIRLIAAFDHRDIFIDPNPDEEKSFIERQRMFALPRSSWQDYDKSIISVGGGIFPRSAKSISLTPEIKMITGIDADEATPTELMNALLKSECELLWFGGIGTYIKASLETNSDAGDKANDLIRINGNELKAKVIGEGANLGATQKGRIEAARNGVRLNTDAIDNSAGVDSSDHEVNIKILLNVAMSNGKLKPEARNDLLVTMTDDVASHVLAHNYNQTLAVSLMQKTASEDIDAHENFMTDLEGLNLLDRRVEYLPSTEEMRALRERGEGLTRPQLAVLTAYGKIHLSSEILATNVTDDEYFLDTLVNYFPDECHKYKALMQLHPLKREIIATIIANHITDIGGFTFSSRLRESAMVGTDAIVRAFYSAEEIFDLVPLFKSINELDLKLAANVQYQCHLDIITALRRHTYWLARRSGKIGGDAQSIKGIIDLYKNGVKTLKPLIFDIVSSFEFNRINNHSLELQNNGLNAEIAKEIAALRLLISSTDIIDIAGEIGASIEDTARIYHKLGDKLRFDELRFIAGSIVSNDHWDKLATRRLIEDFMQEQAKITKEILKSASAKDPDIVFDKWLNANFDNIGNTLDAIQNIETGGNWSFAKLSIVNTQLKEFSN